jgi:peptidyl-prolyl cis-trans isomerase C
MCLVAKTSPASPALAFEGLTMTNQTFVSAELASINGVVLQLPEEAISPDELRQRAYSELLRQEAVAQGLLPASDAATADGVVSEEASSAIEQLLERNLTQPEPSEEACRRHHAAHQANYSTGERVQVRHILFAVTPGMDVVALRNRAETTLLDVRCHDGSAVNETFAKAASTMSNCPSGAEGGDLGWLVTADCAPEFAKELFGHKEIGVLPRLVHSRFGLHVVEILQREAGIEQPFEVVRGAVTLSLKQQSFVTALRQYMQVLAGEADIVGVDIEAADTPLVQ